jgi:hypothetical protein
MKMAEPRQPGQIKQSLPPKKGSVDVSINQAEQGRTPIFWAAPELIDAGYRVFPVDSKAPTVEGGFYGATIDKSQVAAWIEDGHGDHDVAVPTGVFGGIVAIDADTPEAYEKMVAKYGLPTYTTKKGGHWLFQHPRNGKVVSNKIAPGLDRKGDGGYVIFPPSKGRKWTNDTPRAKDLPTLPQEFWSKTKGPTPGERTIPAERKDVAATLIAKHVRGITPDGSEGGRHDHLRHLCGVLLGRGVSLVDAEDILTAAWGKVGGDLADRLDSEVPNTLATTQGAIREERATGVPSMEKITPGLFNELAPVMGWLREITFGDRKRRGDNSVNSDNKLQDLAELPDPEEFPISALPITVRQFIREASASVGCPADYVGLSTLAAVSAAIGDTRRIVIKRDWTEGAAIFGMIVGGAASKKTPAMNLALRPVRVRQMALKTEYERQKEEYEVSLARYKEALKDDLEARKPDKPTLVRTYADDTTVERLADILNENRRGVLIIKDELSGWLGAMNQYKQGGKGADRQFWLSVHTNQPVSVDRKSSDEPVIVARPFVSIVGGIQPEVLPDFGKDRGDGLIDRFIPVYPKPQVGRWTDDEISDHVREEYASTLGSLYKLRHANDGEDPFPSKVAMTSEARGLFIAEYNRLHEELEAPGFPQRLRPAWGKLEAYLARFALMIAMTRIAELGNQGQSTVVERITREDMAGAIQLLAYFKNHVRRVYTGLYGDSPSDRLAADLRDFLIDQGGTWEGIASELYDALVSEHKPERVKDFGKLVRAIAKRSALLRLEDLQRTNTRRPFRLTLESVVTVDTVVTPSHDEAPAATVREVW